MSQKLCDWLVRKLYSHPNPIEGQKWLFARAAWTKLLIPILTRSPAQHSPARDMEDIEDLLVGGAAPPGFRFQVAAAVGINSTNNKKKINPSALQDTTHHSLKVPGTQVLSLYMCVRASLIIETDFLFCFYGCQTIYMKTFGCSHNQVTSLAHFWVFHGN